ncbi:helix-turn-helix domain-containing protein [Nocardia sp. BMG51109]|uniref:winged helix-turn-helix transcriptional regulator n=1 Tax=Nocardia sp. BMG51109 TaxID=1056816 RepID=UPI000466F7C4|nr:helix-turn-helix domain-containing protein [Nocardia sp. BMG51109]
MRYEDLADYPCSITRPLVVLGDRWTLLVLKTAFTGVRRFNAFHAAIGIPRGRLQDRLDRLVEHDLLTRCKTADGLYDEYRITPKGHDLYPILMAFRDWGDRYMAPDGPPVHFRHRDCGGEAHVTLACDVCGEPVTARDIAPAPGPGMTAIPTFAGGRRQDTAPPARSA